VRVEYLSRVPRPPLDELIDDLYYLEGDGFVADEHDQPGPLFAWLTSGDVPSDESGVLKVSQTSYDYIRPYWTGSASRSSSATSST
jgi:hypothetical protein